MKLKPEMPIRYGLSPAALVCWGPVIAMVAAILFSKLFFGLARWLAGGN